MAESLVVLVIEDDEAIQSIVEEALTEGVFESAIAASEFLEAQIAFVLKQAEDGPAVAEVCRKAGISEATFYNWPAF